jgi:hypothetical protein
MALLVWIQDTAFSTWIRESDWAIFALLIVHTIGMAAVTGTGIFIALRILGVAPQLSLSLLTRFIPVMVLGLIAAILSGVVLVVSYPAKALTNPLFYLKLTILVTAWLVTRTLFRRVIVDSRFDSGPVFGWASKLAAVSLVLWIIGIAAGKFLAYTNTMLLVY